jgi:hypothetical protein
MLPDVVPFSQLPAVNGQAALLLEKKRHQRQIGMAIFPSLSPVRNTRHKFGKAIVGRPVR